MHTHIPVGCDSLGSAQDECADGLVPNTRGYPVLHYNISQRISAMKQNIYTIIYCEIMAQR